MNCPICGATLHTPDGPHRRLADNSCCPLEPDPEGTPHAYLPNGAVRRALFDVFVTLEVQTTLEHDSEAESVIEDEVCGLFDAIAERHLRDDQHWGEVTTNDGDDRQAEVGLLDCASVEARVVDPVEHRPSGRRDHLPPRPEGLEAIIERMTDAARRQAADPDEVATALAAAVMLRGGEAVIEGELQAGKYVALVVNINRGTRRVRLPMRPVDTGVGVSVSIEAMNRAARAAGGRPIRVDDLPPDTTPAMLEQLARENPSPYRAPSRLDLVQVPAGVLSDLVRIAGEVLDVADPSGDPARSVTMHDPWLRRLFEARSALVACLKPMTPKGDA